MPISGQLTNIIHLPQLAGHRHAGGPPLRFNGGAVRGKTEQSAQNHDL